MRNLLALVTPTDLVQFLQDLLARRAVEAVEAQGHEVRVRAPIRADDNRPLEGAVRRRTGIGSRKLAGQ
jgi:hypothetical protein